MPEAYVWGIMMIVCGCFSSAAGMLLMKLSSDVGEHEQPLWRRWRWGLGFLLLVVNATAIDLIAYGITPLSLIAPFAGLTIVFSTLLAATGLLTERELPTLRSFVATLLVLAGVTIVSVFGPHGDGSPEIPRMTPTSVGFTATSFMYTLGWLVVSKVFRVSPGSAAYTLASALAAACCGMITQVAIKQISVTVVGSVSAGSSAGWSDPSVWVALGALPLTAPLQLWLLNGTLAAAKVGYAVPAYQSMLILMTTAAAGVVFGEFDSATPLQLSFFGGGVGCALLGLAALTSAPLSSGELAESLLDGARVYSHEEVAASPVTPERAATAAARQAGDLERGTATPSAPRLFLPDPSPDPYLQRLRALPSHTGLAIAALSSSSPYVSLSGDGWRPRSRTLPSGTPHPSSSVTTQRPPPRVHTERSTSTPPGFVARRSSAPPSESGAWSRVGSRRGSQEEVDGAARRSGEGSDRGQ